MGNAVFQVVFHILELFRPGDLGDCSQTRNKNLSGFGSVNDKSLFLNDRELLVLSGDLTVIVNGKIAAGFFQACIKIFSNDILLVASVEPGDEVFVSVYSINGEMRKYRFIVRSEKVYAKTDPEQFAARDGYFLNLSTSWPVGTARERYVVTTELAGL